MGWKGIACGVVLGGVFGRTPVGALVGAVVGNWLEGRFLRPREAGRAAGCAKARLQARAGGRKSPLHTVCLMAADYAILGLKPDASLDEVRRAYRRLAKRHHPDLMRAKGYTEQEIADAAEYMSRINAAYSRIKSS